VRKEMAAAVGKEYKCILAAQSEPSTAAGSSAIPASGNQCCPFSLAVKRNVWALQLWGCLDCPPCPALRVLQRLAACEPVEGAGCAWCRKMPTGYGV